MLSNSNPNSNQNSAVLGALNPMNTNYQSNISNNLNGRVDIKTPNTSQLFALYDKIPANQCTTYRNPTEGLWNETKLSIAFFSQANIQMIQNGLRAAIYKKSNGQYFIGEQDCDSLKIIMRSIFLQYSANQPHHIQAQVANLNKMVLDYCTEQVYSEAQGYMKYLNDVSTLAIPIAHPVMADNTDRELVFNGWF
jgi:hypothetical protein